MARAPSILFPLVPVFLLIGFLPTPAETQTSGFAVSEDGRWIAPMESAEEGSALLLALGAPFGAAPDWENGLRGRGRIES